MALHMLRLVVLGNHAQVFWQRLHTVESHHATEVPFTLSFDFSDDLKWYLRHYDGNYGEGCRKKVRIVRQEMKAWGQKLFELFFLNPSSPKGMLFFHEAVRAGLDKCELAISSNDGRVLSMPWELIYSPDYHYLVPQLCGMYRTWTGPVIHVPFPHLCKKPLNILLVISRPFGHPPLRPAVLARSLLENLTPLIQRGRVKLTILRPPTFLQLERELNENKDHYHVVHFNGHGGLGRLLFETIRGKTDKVTRERIMESLGSSRIPIFILDACHSGEFFSEKHHCPMEGQLSTNESFQAASFATELLALGAKAVIAMGYSVRSKTSRKFLLKFYGELLNSKSVAQSVAAGRKLLLTEPNPFSKFPSSLRWPDWIIPVLYQQEHLTPCTKSSKAECSFRAALDADPESLAEKKILVGLPYTDLSDFFGREFEISSIERLFQESNIVFLIGGKGNGKTELSLFLARMLARTSGRQSVFYRSFKDEMTLQIAVRDIGETFMGEEFGQYDFQRQRTGVINYLRNHSSLLIWDQLDSVEEDSNSKMTQGYKDRAEEISNFLRKLLHRQTWILVISRRDEKWLRCKYKRFHLDGLSERDRYRFTLKVLHDAQIRVRDVARRAKLNTKTVSRQIERVADLLQGNPLCLKQELPKLSYMTPEELMSEIEEELKKNSGVFYA